MHSAFKHVLPGILALALAAPALAQSDSFSSNDRSERGPRQRITGPVDCVAQPGFSCPTGTQGFGGINRFCLPPLGGSFIPKNWSCAGGASVWTDDPGAWQAIVEIFVVQDCFRGLYNATQAQDRPMMAWLAQTCGPDRSPTNGVPPVLQGEIQNCWTPLRATLAEITTAFEGMQRRPDRMPAREVNAHLQRAKQILAPVQPCLAGTIRGLHGYVKAATAGGGPQTAQAPTTGADVFSSSDDTTQTDPDTGWRVDTWPQVRVLRDEPPAVHSFECDPPPASGTQYVARSGSKLVAGAPPKERAQLPGTPALNPCWTAWDDALRARLVSIFRGDAPADASGLAGLSLAERFRHWLARRYPTAQAAKIKDLGIEQKYCVRLYYYVRPNGTITLSSQYWQYPAPPRRQLNDFHLFVRELLMGLNGKAPPFPVLVPIGTSQADPAVRQAAHKAGTSSKAIAVHRDLYVSVNYTPVEEEVHAQWFANDDYPEGAYLAACKDEPSVNPQATLSRSKGLIYPGDPLAADLAGHR